MGSPSSPPFSFPAQCSSFLYRHQPSRRYLGLSPRPLHPWPVSPTPDCSFLGTSQASGLGLALTLQVCTWGLSVPQVLRSVPAPGIPGFSPGPDGRMVKIKLILLLPLATWTWRPSLRASSSNCRTTRPRSRTSGETQKPAWHPSMGNRGSCLPSDGPCMQAAPLPFRPAQEGPGWPYLQEKLSKTLHLCLVEAGGLPGECD